MLIKFVKGSRFIHIFTVLFNIFTIKGRKNKITGILRGLIYKTALHIDGEDNTVVLGKSCKVSASGIRVMGSGNRIIISEAASLDKTDIWIVGDNNTLELGAGGKIYNCEFGMQQSGNLIKTDDNVSLGGYLQVGAYKSNAARIGVYAFEGKSIVIGEDTIVAEGTVIRTSDSHSIYDMDGTRVNHAGDVFIGKKVWVCPGVTFLKGSGVGDFSVVGIKSLVTRDFSDSRNTLVLGTPAKIVKDNIYWELSVEQAE